MGDRERRRIEAAGAVVVDGGRVLLVLRGRAPARGRWSLPGGKLEPGETPAEAVVREVREETGLEVAVMRSLGLVVLEADGVFYAIHEHCCAPVGPDVTPRAGDDAEEARWVTRAEAGALGISPGVAALIDACLSPGAGSA